MHDESILTTIKRSLGIIEEHTHFDLQLTTLINTVFATLHQLGIGPEDGFEITDNSANWTDFYSEKPMNTIRTYVYLKVRQLFDPPDTGYLVTALDEQIKELEWRLSVKREEEQWDSEVFPSSSNLPI